MLTYTQALAGGQPVVTAYTYNADQLATATASDDPTTWNYTYDLEGRLAEVTPSGGSLAGAQRYSYSAAGYLVQTESHDGTAYQPQAEMVYNGLGQRQSMTAHAGGLSLATTYTLDSEQNAAPLMATANGQTTYYLYGLEPVAERAASWNYYLRDGLGSVRRLADSTGEIVLERNYTPWGDVLTQSGTLTPAHGYLGGWVDAATGLIYVGNGQYYDPATGRFLTRDAQPGQFNPYLPNRGDPTGLLIGPLALVALVRRKKGGKANLFLVALVVLLVGGITLTACTPPIDGKPPKTPTQPTSGNTGTPTPTSTSTSTPTQTSSPTMTPTPTATCTSAPKNWLPEKVKFTRYVTVKENDTFFASNDPTWSNAVHIEKTPGGKETTLTVVPVWRFYVGNADSPTWGVYWNGSGELHHPDSLRMSNGQKYVKADTNNTPPGFNAAYYFTNQITGACGSELDANSNIIAVASNFFRSPDHNCGDQYYINIPGFENTIFTVSDSGTFVVDRSKGEPDHFDLYVGIQDRESFDASPLAQYDGQPVQVAKVQP